MLLSLLTFLGGLAATAGPWLSVAGGPVGMVIAWLGSRAKSGTLKWLAIGSGLVILVGVSVGLTVHIQHLSRDAAAYKLLRADVNSIEQHYGCPARAAHERDLAACLTARERDVAAAQAKEIQRQRTAAALEQAHLDRENRKLDALLAADEGAIRAAPAQDDGPVPKVLLDSWARERRARGLK